MSTKFRVFELQDYIPKILQDLFKGTEVESVIPSVEISQFELEQYQDEKRMNMTFSLLWGPDIKIEFYLSLKYSREDRIGYSLECKINSEETSLLGDLTGDFKNDFLNKQAYDPEELEEQIAACGDNYTKSSEEYGKLIAWMVTVIIAESNYRYDHTFFKDPWRFK